MPNKKYRGTGKRTSKKDVALAQPLESSAMDDKYKVEGAYSDLMRAEEHKKDPELMDKVHKHARKQLKSIKSIKDITNYKNNKYGANGFGDDDGDE